MIIRNRLQNGGTRRAEGWGVDSEYGRLLDVLVGPPDHFFWTLGNSVVARSRRINAKFDMQAAVAQHTEMVSAFEAAGVRVHHLRPDADLPYQIFARDSSVMTPWGAVIMQMQKPFRRGEYAECLRFYLENEIPIYDLVTAGNVEGGDFMVLQPGVALCGFSGERSSEAGMMQLRSWFEAEGWEFHSYAYDPHFLHLDVQVGIVSEGLAAVCVEAVEPEFVAWLRSRKFKIIDVTYADAMQLGCNVMSLGDGRAMIPKSNKKLIERCKAEGIEVFSPDIPMIAAGGGGIHCLCQPLQRVA